MTTCLHRSAAAPELAAAGKSLLASYPVRPNQPLPSPLDLYLREVRLVPRLTPAESEAIAHCINQERYIVDQLAALAAERGEKLLAQEAAARLGVSVEEMLAIDEKAASARDRLIESHLYLAVRIACKYKNRIGGGFDYLDLIQEGNIALALAAEHFDPNNGASFQQFAARWVRCQICQAFSKKSRLIRLPERIALELVRLKRVGAALASKLGRIPSIEELAAALLLTEERTRTLLQWGQRAVSLNLKIGEDGDGSELETAIAASEPSPLDALLRGEELAEARRKLNEAWRGMSKPDKLRFGERYLELMVG